MPERLQVKPRGTEFVAKPYKRGGNVFVPYQPQGMNRDHPPNELGPEVWSDGSGMLFRNDAAERQGGELQAENLVGTPAPFRPQYLLTTNDQAQVYWLYPSDNNIGVWNGQATFDITPTPPPVGALFPLWTGGTLSNLAVLNQAGQAPWYWDGQVGNPMLPLPGWIVGSTAGSLRAFKSFLIAMNITEAGLNGSTVVRWSDAADPGFMPSTWSPAPDNDAGDAVLATTPGAIIDGWPLRDTFVIYKDHATHLMQFVGGQFVMLLRKVLVTSGILSRNCAVEVLGRHVTMTDGDVILFDGQNAISLIQDRMKRWLFGQIDGNNFEACFVQAYQSQGEVWVCFPETGHTSANRAAIWDQNSDSWSIRSLYPDTTYIGRGVMPDQNVAIDWDSDAQAWDADTTRWSTSAFNPTHDGLLSADYNNTQLVEYDVGDTHWDGSPIEAFISRSSMWVDAAGNEKLIVAIWPHLDASAPITIQVRIGVQQSYGEPIAWQAPVDFDPQVDLKVDVLAVGRLISAMFSSNSGPKWRLKGYALEVQDVGLW